ncbi:MAG: hypothetical protein R2873_11625 [Caldilineaceae bacterium]
MKSVTIQLPESLHRQLAVSAGLAGMPLDEYIIGLLRQYQDTDNPVLFEQTLTSDRVDELLTRIAAIRCTQELEQKHLEGYQRHPVQPGEFDVWIDEQHNDPL